MNNDLSISLNIITNPRDYQLKMYEEAKDKNSIIYMETGKGKSFIAIMIINYLITGYYLKKPIDNNLKYINSSSTKLNKKIVYLVCEISLLNQQATVIKNNTNLSVNTIKGGNALSKKLKSKETFNLLWNSSDVHVCIPDILYKLLYTGYVSIFDIKLLVFDECHHCDQNHSYNLIMEEYYFYYKFTELKKIDNNNGPNDNNNIYIKKIVKPYQRNSNDISTIDNSLPQILGLTASPFKKKLTNDNNSLKNSALLSLINICENLDSVIVADPSLINLESGIINNNYYYNNNKVYNESDNNNTLYKNVLNNITKLNVCNNNTFSIDSKFINTIENNNNSNNDNTLQTTAVNNSSDDIFIEYKDITNINNINEKLNNLIENIFMPVFKLIKSNNNLLNNICNEDYKNYLYLKFKAKDFNNYIKQIQERKDIYTNINYSVLFEVFEKLQRQLFVLLENISFECLFDLMHDYTSLFKYVINDINNITLINSNNNSFDLNTNVLKSIIDVINKEFENSCNNKYNIYSNKDQSNELTSFKLKELQILLLSLFNKHLNSYNNKSDYPRVIIFVENRIVSQKLSNNLNSFFKSKSIDISSVYVVGANSTSSNFSIVNKNSVEIMESNINKFKTGNAQILIGTSTIEEGIDVQSCNYVISYNSIRTPKSYIQMKGRARKINAVFYIFSTNKTKTKSDVDNYVEFFKEIKGLFSDPIYKNNSNIYKEYTADFRRSNYIQIKKDSKINFRYLFKCKNSQAKISINNSKQIINEIITDIRNKHKVNYLKINKTDYKQIKISLTSEGYQFKFVCIISFSFPLLNNYYNSDVISDEFYSKDMASSHAYLLLIVLLYNNNVVDDNLKCII